MQIALIGHGRVGGALAKRFAAAGHEVVIGARNPQDVNAQQLISVPGITATGLLAAATRCDVIVVATPPTAAPAVAQAIGRVPGKIIIDATNAVREKPDPYPTAFAAFRALTDAAVVKCFNSTGFENMANPRYGEVAIDMFMAGSDPKAKAVARQLAMEIGFAECYDFGGDEKVELLEQFALSWINLALIQGLGRGMAFKLLRR